MKRFILMVCATIALLVSANIAEAQVVKNGKTFETTKTVGASNDVKTDYTWKDSKGQTYPIYLHKYEKGDKAGEWTAYVYRVSQKTSKEYKYYLPSGVEIAKEIKKDLGLK